MRELKTWRPVARGGAVLVGLLVAAATMGAAAPAQAASSVATQAQQFHAAVAAGKPAPKNCTYDSDGNGMQCVTVSKKATRSTFQVAWQDELKNDTNRTSEFECEASKSKTWTFGFSTSVEMEAGVIFAKAKTQVGFDIVHSRESGRVTRAHISVPAHHTTLCERGVRLHYFKGTVKHIRCSSSKCVTHKGTFKAHAPSTAAWRLRDV